MMPKFLEPLLYAVAGVLVGYFVCKKLKQPSQMSGLSGIPQMPQMSDAAKLQHNIDVMRIYRDHEQARAYVPPAPVQTRQPAVDFPTSSRIRGFDFVPRQEQARAQPQVFEEFFEVQEPAKKQEPEVFSGLDLAIQDAHSSIPISLCNAGPDQDYL